MTSKKSRPASRRAFSTVLAAFLALTVSVSAHAQPTVDHIAKRWTGIEKSGSVVTARKFTLELKQTSDAMRMPVSVTGTWTSTILSGPAAKRVPPQVDHVSGSYDPVTGILVLSFAHSGQRPAGAWIFAVDDEARRMAGLSAVPGAFGEAMPVYAVAGDSLSPELAAAVGQRGGSGRAAREQPIDARMSARLETLRREVMAESPPLDTLTPEQLQAEMKRQQAEYVSAMQSGSSVRVEAAQARLMDLQRRLSGVPASGAASARKPEPAERWMRQVEQHGASLEVGSNPIVITHLFRPRYFTPFFGKTFLDMSAGERKRVAGTLRAAAQRDVALARSRYLASLITVFEGKQDQGFDVVYAGVGSLALDLVAAWDERMLARLTQAPSVADVDAFQDAQASRSGRARLTSTLWPVEAEVRKRYVAELGSGVRLQSLLARIDELQPRAASGGEPLHELGRLPETGRLDLLMAAEREKFTARHEQAVDAALAAWLRQTRSALIDRPPTLETLRRGSTWYHENRDAVRIFSARPAMREFTTTLAAARARAVAAERDTIQRELEALESVAEVGSYSYAIAAGSVIDDPKDPRWEVFADAVRAQQKAILWAAHVARVGTGPFGPEYPGAAYLNAIYRDDREQIEREDRLYMSWVEEQLRTPMQSGMLELARIFGVSITQEQIREEFSRATLVRVVAAAYLFNFEKAYPECLGMEPARFRLTEREVNAWGVTQSRNDWYFSVPARHAAVFKNLQGRKAGGSAYVEKLRPPDDALRTADIIAGIERAMTSYSCSHPVVQRLETNMMAFFKERFL